MKTIKCIYFIGFFIGLSSCNGDDTVEIRNSDVDTYIELLSQINTNLQSYLNSLQKIFQTYLNTLMIIV